MLILTPAISINIGGCVCMAGITGLAHWLAGSLAHCGIGTLAWVSGTLAWVIGGILACVIGTLVCGIGATQVSTCLIGALTGVG